MHQAVTADTHASVPPASRATRYPGLGPQHILWCPSVNPCLGWLNTVDADCMSDRRSHRLDHHALHTACLRNERGIRPGCASFGAVYNRSSFSQLGRPRPFGLSDWVLIPSYLRHNITASSDVGLTPCIATATDARHTPVVVRPSLSSFPTSPSHIKGPLALLVTPHSLAYRICRISSTTLPYYPSCCLTVMCRRTK